MQVELRDIEVHIEPTEILTQAIQDCDISIDDVVNICIDEESSDTVLSAVDNEDIKSYCDKYSIHISLDNFGLIANSIKDFSKDEKAKLLWLLLKCNG
ncbi:hypothetical protein [Sulfurimonas sp.]|uniref:hypothetical protein n=1 Tax=Sulfurimonas sp. TaxID=2022749 RepID=UPI0025F0D379|nr:hypothetical protein [Sulfurimonas sp.]